MFPTFYWKHPIPNSIFLRRESPYFGMIGPVVKHNPRQTSHLHMCCFGL